jgi:hypothetical protein
MVVIDNVRNVTWTINCRVEGISGSVQTAKVTVEASGEVGRSTSYWLLRRDALDCAYPLSAVRREVVEQALKEFKLEAWKNTDQLPVTVAIPRPDHSRARFLAQAGTFCVGLPTRQGTGLPVHVDARFFATISRTGLDFKHAYNAMLLEEAESLLRDLLFAMKDMVSVDDRRLVTLALHKGTGELATRVFAPGGLAEDKVVLTWDGTYAKPSECMLPTIEECRLLELLEVVLVERPEERERLPDSELLYQCSEVLESLGVPSISAPHPWLVARPNGTCVLEEAAVRRRLEGRAFWEPFVAAMLDCFQPEQLVCLKWLPTGARDLAAPAEQIFFPTSSASDDDEEIAEVPESVAAMLRLLDAKSLHLREDGRALSSLALRLEKSHLVQRPRKLKLLEEALFPALAQLAHSNQDGNANSHKQAFSLLAQAVAWISSMKETSRKKLDRSKALVPVQSGGVIRWQQPWRSYFGHGWGLSDNTTSLLARAYPDQRLVPFSLITQQVGEQQVTEWQLAAEVLGVSKIPVRLCWPKRNAPLVSHNLQLLCKPDISLGNSLIDPIYRQYASFLATMPTSWSQSFDHDVAELDWIDGLEDTQRREYVVDLMLASSECYAFPVDVCLRRVDNGHEQCRVPRMWVFALSSLDWPIFPAEQGAGNETVRLPASVIWQLPQSTRRTSFAQLLNTVPHRFESAGAMLSKLGVPLLANAPLTRLFSALTSLADRLEPETLRARPEAFSLAKELFDRVNERLHQETMNKVPLGRRLPLLRDRRLESVDMYSSTARIVFDDDPQRGRFVANIADCFRVPLPREDSVDRIFELFLSTWGAERVLRTSSAPIELSFRPSPGTSEILFVDWLRARFPQPDVALELAALLTFGGERSVRSDRLSPHWKSFSDLKLLFGTFSQVGVSSFYDRSRGFLQLDANLDATQVVAATWELVGTRSRDLLSGYAHALKDGTTEAFLSERDIGEVELADVANLAGLYRRLDLKNLAPALWAARQHLFGGTLEAAIHWWNQIPHEVARLADELGRPDLVELLKEALPARSPEGELQIVRRLQVPWKLWQEATRRVNGGPYTFPATVLRYRAVRDYLVAALRELGAKDEEADLPSLDQILAAISAVTPPERVVIFPPDAIDIDREVVNLLLEKAESFQRLVAPINSLPQTPWTEDALPLPKGATRRGIGLFLDVPEKVRAIEAHAAVDAVIAVAAMLAPTLDEHVDENNLRLDRKLQERTNGSWAHVHAALALLRKRLTSAPRTLAKLTAVNAFKEACTKTSLLAKFPEIPTPNSAQSEPRETVLGKNMTKAELRTDLLAGSNGTLGAMLAEAAKRPLDLSIFAGSRQPLVAAVHLSGRSSSRGRGWTSTGPREPELTGDIGEAFVHEWLNRSLGDDYGPECWVSKARSRYGLAESGSDDYGFDFKVPHQGSRLLPHPAKLLLIEVKSTTGDGNSPFPMTSWEWERAKECPTSRRVKPHQ